MAPQVNFTPRAAPAPPLPNPKDNNAPQILAVVCTLTAVSLFVNLLRFYVRAFMLKHMGVDDWVMVSATVCSVTVMICVIYETKNGLGHHEADIPIPELENMLHWQFYHSILIMCGISLVKISVGFFLMRFVNSKLYKRFVIGMIVFLVLFTIACAGTLIFACIPVAASWNLALKATANCYDNHIFLSIALFNSSINIFTDVVFALLPIPIIWNLQINQRTKITLSIILSLGLFACAVAIYKTYVQSQFFKTPDFTYDDAYFLWNDVEFCAGLLAASLPTLRPLFTWFFDTAMTVMQGGRTTGQTREKRSQYGQASYNSRNGPRSGAGMTYGLKSMGRSANKSQALETEDELYLAGHGPTHKTTVSATRYMGDRDDGSEEDILPSTIQRGIIVRKNYDVSWEDRD